MKFQKRPPNPFAFAPIPKKYYEQAGTVEHKPLACAILSRLCAGVARRNKRYTTTTQRTFTIAAGETWCSLRTIRQDYFVATGCRATRGEVIGAIKWLKRNGLIVKSENALPETNGRYGKVFSLSDNLLKSSDEMVDVIREHRLFTFGDIKEYKFSGRRTEYEPGKFTKEAFRNNIAWREGIEQNGFASAAYTTVGQWRFPERGDPNAPVFLPWIVVDIDRTNFLEAHEDAKTAIIDFEAAGFDSDSIFPAFSGSKGFHLMLSTRKMGWPIFANAYDAMECVREFITELTDVEFDIAVCNPLQVYRVAGSKNLKSGLYKTMYTLDEFLSKDINIIFEEAKKSKSWKWPRKAVEVENDLIEVLRTGANRVLKQRVNEHRKDSEKGYNGIGKTIGQIIDGVSEGDVFGDNHTGRHKAAYILSAFMLEHPKQHEAVRKKMGLPVAGDLSDPNSVFEALQWWYDNRTQMMTDHIKLKEPFGSAQRTIARKYGRN